MGDDSPAAAEGLPALDFAATMAGLPLVWPDLGLRQRIREGLKSSGTCVVVIDDDPTGTQTVHGVPVLTTWAVSDLEQELAAGTALFYLLSNSRALPQAEAVALAREMGANLRLASSRCGRPIEVISRSDSTLRGHYPAETDALAEALELSPDAIVIAPYFREGGRYTIDDVHYVKQGGSLVPAAQTEFARDRAFGYRHSDLRLWTEEKTCGRWQHDRAVSLPLDTIREGGPDALLTLILPLRDGTPLVVNAADDRDLEVVVTALARASALGKRFLYRTAASFAKVRGGITDRPLLQPADLPASRAEARGGLVVVGSYVPLSSRQLARLAAEPGWVPIEVDVASVVDGDMRAQTLRTVAAALAGAMAADANVVLFTSRAHLAGADSVQSLAIGRQASEALVQLVRGLPVPPRFLIAKGGITSSDIATRALGVRRALVLGQIAPGVPVWQLGDESRLPGLPYVVFPGNVGSDETLAQVASALAARR